MSEHRETLLSLEMGNRDNLLCSVGLQKCVSILASYETLRARWQADARVCVCAQLVKVV